MAVEPVPGEPAAIADLGGERALVVADYHAGLEVALRFEGVDLRSRATDRRERMLDLLGETDADRVIVLGDLGEAIGGPGGEEREEIVRLLGALAERGPVTIVKGNHDGDLEPVIADHELADVEVTPSTGTRLGRVGFAHGHTWPAPAVIEAPTVCVAHEHPIVRLEDEVGGARLERVWLRGTLTPDPFESHHDRAFTGGSLVVFPAFNDLVGGTWVNSDGQEFLSPFLPAGLANGEAYLLDGTRLGDYRQI